MAHIKLLLILLVVGVAPSLQEDRLDCILTETVISQEECKARGCIWDAAPPKDQFPAIPQCSLDPKLVGYTGSSVARKSGSGFDADLVLKKTAAKSTPNLELIPELKLSVSYLSDQIVRIKITDPKEKRFEVPLEHFNFNIPKSDPTEAPKNPAYDVVLKEDFNLVVSRKSTGSKLIDTSIGGLIYSDQFMQIASYLPSTDVYGFGENMHRTLRRNLTYITIPIFTRDQDGVHSEFENLYGHHPFFSVVEKDGKAFGVFLFNTSPISYTMLPAPAVALKAAGGVLDLFVFVGESPENVIQLYTSLIGRAGLPAFWALGNQQSRWYSGKGTTAIVREVIQRNIDAGVPLDVMYIDSDYKEENREFDITTRFNGLNDLIKEFLAKYQIRWVPIIDPCVLTTGPANYTPWIEGQKQSVFIGWPADLQDKVHVEKVIPDKRFFYSHMWPDGPVSFVDFFKSTSRQYWKDMLWLLYQDFHWDGLWDDMNEPATWNTDKCPDDKYALIRPHQGYTAHIHNWTICMSTVQGDQGQYRHYDVHSLYALSEMKPTQDAIHEITGKRGFILSRSSFPSSGQFTAHWLGDTAAKWEVLRWTLIGMMEMNMFGISFVGVDICGFYGVPTAELCKRWMQAGAYFPFSRNHNNGGQPDHDPAIFISRGQPEVTHAGIAAYRTRYQLLHYLYTRFYRSHVFGDTVMRPLVHQFPTDHDVRGIYEQFLLGPTVMVNPFLYENQTSVRAFIPTNSSWYRFSKNGTFVEKAPPVLEGSEVEFDDSESSRPLLFKDHSILAIIPETGLPKLVNSATIRKVPLELWVLPCHKGQGTGELFFDDGESIDTVGKGHYSYFEFSLDKCQLEIDVKSAGYVPGNGTSADDILQLSSINVALWTELPAAPKVTLDGAEVKTSLTKNELKLNLDKPLDLLKLKKDQKVVVRLGEGTECFKR